MKRILGLLLGISLVLSTLAPCALANSWGLSGELYKAVSAVDTWDEYSAICKQAGDMAVMGSRYHNVLMQWDSAARNGLRLHTKAVYQPGDERARKVKIVKQADRLTLSYGADEQYVFQRIDGVWELAEAVVGAFRVSGAAYEYMTTDGSQSSIWNLRVTLRDFNIQLFPHSVAEVRQLNHMCAALDSGAHCLGYWEDNKEQGTYMAGMGSDTVPVYSSPFGASAWRAANGKAAVSLKGELWRLKTVKDDDGRQWACVCYDVSPRTQRIGYIQTSALAQDAAEPGTIDDCIRVHVRATRNTYLTDDPNVSQYPQFNVPQGTLLECIGMYNDDYAYVTAEVRDGRFVDGGAIIYGFVPLRDLTVNTSTDEHIPLPDVMAQLAGTWVFEAGGSMAEDLLRLNADGSYQGSYSYLATSDDDMDTRGTWYVTAYSPRQNLYWNDPPYEITLLSDNGHANVKGLTFDESTMSLTYWEGGGGYRRQ